MQSLCCTVFRDVVMESLCCTVFRDVVMESEHGVFVLHSFQGCGNGV